MITDPEGMLVRVISELEQRDRLIAELHPKADAYDKLSQVLDLMPKRSQGYGEDIVWSLKHELEKVRAEKAKPSPEVEA